MTAIYGNSPWTREAVRNLSPEQLAAIDAILPDEMFVSLGCGRNRGQWSVHLMQEAPGRAVELVRVGPVHDIVNGVRTALARLEGAA